MFEQSDTKKMSTVVENNNNNVERNTAPKSKKRKAESKTHGIVKPRSRYSFFSKEKREEIINNLNEGDDKPSATEMIKLISEAWKKLDSTEKYEKMAADDIDRFQKEIEEAGLTPADFGMKKKLKKKATDPNIPKKPTNAFFDFFRDNVDKTREENKDVKFQTIREMLSTKWKAMDSDDPMKKKYVDHASKRHKEWVEAKKQYMESDAHKDWVEANT